MAVTIKKEINNAMLKASDYTIKKYFEIYNEMIIPMYQRGYSWEEKNMNTFLNDIYTHEDYYIGNMMVIGNGRNKSVDIIDGQQRLISIFLILACLKNEYGVNIGNEFDMKKGRKLIIENRSPLSTSQILKAIHDNALPEKLRCKNEYVIYKKIKKIIDQTQFDINKLYQNILNLKIVEIKFLSSKMKAHDTFVNLNTKGKILEDIDIIKSKFFSYLITSDRLATKYKEDWYSMLELIGLKNHQKYFDAFVDVCLPVKNKKMKRLDIFLNELNSVEKAKELYKSFVINEGEQNDFCSSAGAIFNHNLELIRDKIDDSNYSFDELDLIIKLYDKAKFKQFDIVLISLLYFKDSNDKRTFINKYQFIKKFLLFVLMHQTVLSIRKTSPSTYGNSFKEVAQRIYKGENIETVAQSFIQKNIKVLNKKEIIDDIKETEIHDNTYQAKLVIQLVMDDYTSDYIIDHFAKQSGSYKNRFKIGNCVPISQDNFGETEVKEKIELYKTMAESEKYVREILKYDINEKSCDQVINQRTERYANDFAEKYEKLKNDILNREGNNETNS